MGNIRDETCEYKTSILTRLRSEVENEVAIYLSQQDALSRNGGVRVRKSS